jgi:hypothetical protein
MTQYDPYSAVAPQLPFALAPQLRPLATIQGKFPLTVLTLEDGPRGGVCICEYYGPCQPTRIWNYDTYLDALNALFPTGQACGSTGQAVRRRGGTIVWTMTATVNCAKRLWKKI